ncbi:hypothetical protein L3X38_017280 [Prunus dulcis]|uniref:Uncharacterized protein n=1 Tax=Prunus dulcis TaxID=3755 RepID=A0AAD4W713_PRUDU|nr:hypothetical protein L3X38_017280 [Prunus dulcis]
MIMMIYRGGGGWRRTSCACCASAARPPRAPPCPAASASTAGFPISPLASVLSSPGPATKSKRQPVCAVRSGSMAMSAD